MCIIIIERGGAEFSSFTTTHSRHYLANKNETRRITRAENHLLHIRQQCAEIKTIQCVCACYNMLCCQSSTEGWKSKNQKGAKIRIGNQIIPIITCIVFICPLWSDAIAYIDGRCAALFVSKTMHPHVNNIYKGWSCSRKILFALFYV